MVRAEVRRRAIETGEQPRYGDVVRALVRDGLCLPPAHVEVGAATAADIAGVGIWTLLSSSGEEAPISRILPGGGRRYRLASLLRWMAADLRTRRDAARAVQAELSDGVDRG